MPDNKASLRLAELDNALSRLQEILNTPTNHIGRVDAIIQRFEFCYELMWKSIKACLELQGVEATSPRDVFQKAYAQKWINDEKLWLSMLNDRNLTSHTYHEAIATEITSHVPNYLKEMLTLKEKLSGIQNGL
jgi:nucleotidyltransferase substrate binding protein (TIGR01987 family)